MVVLIGRHRGIRIKGFRLEFLFPRDEDFSRSIVDKMARTIFDSDPIRSGDLAQASDGLALADRIRYEIESDEPVWLFGVALVDDVEALVSGSKSSGIRAVADMAAIVIRALLRSSARPREIKPTHGEVVFVTDPLQASIPPGLRDPRPPLVNLRREADTLVEPGGVWTALREAWRQTAGMHGAARLRMTRLKFESADLDRLVGRLVEAGMTHALLMDITGHRPRLVARACVARGVKTSIHQHGRIGNPCCYIPVVGTRFISISQEDLARLKELTPEQGRVEWGLLPERPTAPMRAGSGILICPSYLGSSERFAELLRVVERLLAQEEVVGVRFHPSERMKRLKGLRIGVEVVSSSMPFSMLDGRWGRAIVPFKSTVVYDLARAGFRVIEI